MKSYSSIDRFINQDLDIVAFDKLDGRMESKTRVL